MHSELAPPISQPLGSVTTERMHLRPFTRNDRDAIAVVFAKPKVWRFPYGRGLTREESDAVVEAMAAGWERFGFGCWVAELLPDNRIIGYVGLSVPQFLPEILPAVEVGWRLDPDYWGQGLATEGANVALREGFVTMGLREICSLPQSDNPRSSRVCERIGMSFDRVVVCPATDRRGAVEAKMYTLASEAWESRRGFSS
jgi:RimJ/RimL family protein N-acetyltransferase